MAVESAQPRSHGTAEFIAAASLPGLLTLPLAWLHNQESLLAERLPPYASALQLVIAEALLGSLLAWLGLRLVRRGRQAPRLAGSWATSFVLGGAAGLLAWRVLEFADPCSSAVQWVLMAILYVGSALSAGMFCLFGAPLVFIRRRPSEVHLRRVPAAVWLTLAAVGGGGLVQLIFCNVVDRTGAGVEGMGLFALLIWPYFCWGAGIGAVLGGRHGHDARTERHDAA